MNVYPEWAPYQEPENATPQQIANTKLMNALSAMNVHNVIQAFHAGANMSLQEKRVTPGLGAIHVLALYGGSDAIPVLEAIFARGIPVDQISGEGWSALHYAANRSYDSPASSRLIATLLRLGANPELESWAGTKPLDLGLGHRIREIEADQPKTKRSGPRP